MWRGQGGRAATGGWCMGRRRPRRIQLCGPIHCNRRQCIVMETPRAAVHDSVAEANGHVSLTAGTAVTGPPLLAGQWPEGGPIDPRNSPAALPATIVDAKKGIVQIPRSKLAIVGFAHSRNDAPYDDPEWSVFTLNQLYRYAKRADLHAEIHAREVYTRDIVRDTDYVGWLRACPIPLFMLEVDPDIPMAVRYPIDAVNAWLHELNGDATGVDYLTSSPAYMLAYALWSRAMGINPHLTTAGIWGIDLIVGQEYDYQKPCMEFWLGVAKGLGVRLDISPKSALVRTLQRYGLSASHVTFGPFH